MSAIHYTLSTIQTNDGEVIPPADPSPIAGGGTLVYSAPLVINQPTRVKARVVISSTKYSAVTSEYYSKLPVVEQVEAVDIKPPGHSGPAGSVFEVTLTTATTGADIYYIIGTIGSSLNPIADGTLVSSTTLPSGDGSVSEPVIVTVPCTIFTAASKTGLTSSVISSASFTTVDVPAKVSNPVFGLGATTPLSNSVSEFVCRPNTLLSFNLLCWTQGSSITYVADSVARDPLTSAEAVTFSGVPGFITLQTLLINTPTVISAIATKAGCTNSDVVYMHFIPNGDCESWYEDSSGDAITEVHGPEGELGGATVKTIAPRADIYWTSDLTEPYLYTAATHTWAPTSTANLISAPVDRPAQGDITSGPVFGVIPTTIKATAIPFGTLVPCGMDEDYDPEEDHIPPVWGLALIINEYT